LFADHSGAGAAPFCLTLVVSGQSELAAETGEGGDERDGLD
jgi:hypothetical protein